LLIVHSRERRPSAFAKFKSIVIERSVEPVRASIAASWPACRGLVSAGGRVLGLRVKLGGAVGGLVDSGLRLLVLGAAAGGEFLRLVRFRGERDDERFEFGDLRLLGRFGGARVLHVRR
jgi:hypothetical protein